MGDGPVMTTDKLRSMYVNGELVEMPMSSWDAVYRQISAWAVEDLQEREDHQRVTGQIWTAIYWSHYVKYEKEFFSLEEAESFLRTGWEYGDLTDEGIRLPGGTFVRTDCAQLPAKVKS